MHIFWSNIFFYPKNCYIFVEYMLKDYGFCIKHKPLYKFWMGMPLCKTKFYYQLVIDRNRNFAETEINRNRNRKLPISIISHSNYNFIWSAFFPIDNGKILGFDWNYINGYFSNNGVYQKGSILKSTKCN